MSKKRKVLISIFVVFILLLNACGQGEVMERRGEKDSTYQAGDVGKDFVHRQTEFGLELYQQILAQEGEQENIFISPLSVSLALALVYNGAVGETKKEMEEALGLQGLSLEEINQGYLMLKNSLEYADPEIDLRIRESLWMRKGLEFQDEYLQNLQHYYHAETQQIDFTSQQSVDRINEWVKRSTNNKIDKMVDQLDPDTLVLLLNTVYFLGDWTTPFEKDFTNLKDFHLLDGSTKKHPLMRSVGRADYLENKLFQSVRLPYGEERYSMYVFLPQENRELAEVSQLLLNHSAKERQDMMQSYSNQQGTIELPRFELDYEIDLISTLKNMGLEAAFGPHANFTNMLAGLDSPIDEVKHKTYIRTDEKGTEAAGATMVAMPTSAPMEQFSMIVDRPFLFMIQEEETGAILFLGTIVNPEDI